MSDSIYVDNAGDDPNFKIALMVYLVKCPKCERKVFVSLPLIGTQHHMSPTIICVDCFDFESAEPFLSKLSAEDLEKIKSFKSK